MELEEVIQKSITEVQRAMTNATEAKVVTEEYVLEAEAYYNHPIPDVWRAVLLALGHVPTAVPFRSGSLTLDPMLSAEDEVETSDGQMLSENGLVVIAYLEGVGDRVVLAPTKNPSDPFVALHTHGTAEFTPLGQVSSFLHALAGQIDQGNRG